LGLVSSLVSEKKIFEISANQSILLSLAAMLNIRLTLDPMGKCSNAFFSETTNMIEAKLYTNVHWMVLYKLYVCCSDMKYKMAAAAVLIIFVVSEKAFEHFPIGSNVNLCPAVVYKLYVFCSDMKFKMVATAGVSLTLEPMGKIIKNASSLKPLG
jgi:hypothetical protein